MCRVKLCEVSIVYNTANFHEIGTKGITKGQSGQVKIYTKTITFYRFAIGEDA